MTEVLFILTVIFVAYIFYGYYNNNERNNSKKTESTSLFKPPGNREAKLKIKTVVEQQSSSPAKKTKAAKTNKKPSPKIELGTVLMKNPATGEEAKVASNYRMAKRWVKEALVEEKLLDKIYKTNEMDDAAKAKVAEALSIIKAMDKYRV